MSEQVPEKTGLPLKADSAFSVEDIRLAANTIRCLVADAVERAQSGHPGGPLGMADVATTLFLHHLKYWPDDPEWPDRDRFVLSAGHASALLYSLLHLAGYRLSLEDLKNFRQVGSLTPGHPEVGRTPGVETTTGPLGQGCGNGVGMALAEAILANRFNRWGSRIVDHRTFVLASDGDMMEGISHEVFSLAGHLRLHKLIVIYDSNRVTIEGPTALTWNEDIRRRFESYDWRVLEVDGHDIPAVSAALAEACSEAERPVLLITHTHIAWGSPNTQDAAASHGAPLGADEVRALKANLGFPPDREFYIPDRVREIFALRRRTLEPVYREWKAKVRRLERQEPEFRRRWREFHSLTGPPDLEDALPHFPQGEEIATRKASGAFLQAAAAHMPNLLGGSADLGPSNHTIIRDAASIAPGDFSGRNIHFGVREHAMGAILNGMALHGALRVYGGTFLVFADYFRPAIRMAALMNTGPTALILTRQKVVVLDRSQCAPAELTRRGAYVLWENEAPPELVIMASGSEVGPSLAAGQILAGEGRRVRVVSFPSWELFDEQPDEYRRAVLGPDNALRVVVEAGRRTGWERYAGPGACFVTVEAFGLSGPWKALRRKFGLDTERILAAIRRRL